ncbi:MAG: ChaN family lipoprotein [Planctomycetes bacterium]|nr:ChaN family lipoprotein [Planctomycetota bacterium]
MRVATTFVAIGLLSWCGFTANADKVEFKDEATFSVKAAPGYQREIVVVFPKPSAKRELTLAQQAPAFTGTSFVALEDCCQGARRMTQDEPEAAGDPDADALRRRKLAAAFEAGLKKLGLEPAQRKFVRVTAMAFEGSSGDAMRLYAAGKLDCDQLIMVDPVIEELPTVGAGQKMRAIDMVLPSRSDAEAVRRFADVITRLGPWSKTARVFTGAGEWGVQRTLELFRGYQVHDPKRAQPAMDTPFRTATRLEDIRSACKSADVVIVGELHGNPGAHTLQLDVLELLQAKAAQPLALSTEQFERDTQAGLDAFLTQDLSKMTAVERGKMEQAFMKETRAWPNYADYRPLVEFCRTSNLPVIAGNVPRPLAARINKEGPEAFEKFTPEEKAWCASKINAPEGAYKDKFFEVMGSSTSAKKDDRYAAMERMYNAQCLKDDTMAESIVAWLDKNKGGKVLHINGAFHSAGGLGVPEKLKALRPELKIVVITCVEADNPFTAEVEPDDAKGNDFVVFVPGSRPNRSSEGPAHPK